MERIIGNELFVTYLYKKFCIALTNVGLPNLIAFDLVHVSPMSSMYGNVAYK